MQWGATKEIEYWYNVCSRYYTLPIQVSIAKLIFVKMMTKKKTILAIFDCGLFSY